MQSGLRLPVNIAFVPNPGPNPTDPLYYVAEHYGSIKVVARSGQVSDYATGLLDYTPGTGSAGDRGDRNAASSVVVTNGSAIPRKD